MTRPELTRHEAFTLAWVTRRTLKRIAGKWIVGGITVIRENREADAKRLTNITPFVRGIVMVNRKSEQAEIDAENSRKDKADALLSATRVLTHLVKRAKANGRPHHLIVQALRAQLGIVKELDALRGNA